MREVAAFKSALADTAAAVARFLLGPENRAMSSKTEMRFGRKGSLSVATCGPRKGLWFDHEAGFGGDLVTLIQRERGVGFKEAAAFAVEFMGGHFGRSDHAARKRITKSARARSNGVADEASRVKSALDLWKQSISVRGTVAEFYLASRGIHPLPNGIEDALRFNPAGIYGRQRLPLLVGLYRDIVTNEPCGVHRTALTAAGEKIGRKYLGRKSGAAIKLSADDAVEQGLTIGEGIETTLSGLALGLVPAWALGDAGELGRFPVLPGIDALTILIDHDANGAGQRQGAKCLDRWLCAGREVLTFQPNQVGHDINDLLGARK